MEFIRDFLDSVSSFLRKIVQYKHIEFVLVVILFVIGSFCWYCHVFGDPNDPTSRCQSWKNMAVWTNFLAVLLIMYVIGRQQIYPERGGIAKPLSPLDQFKQRFA